MASRLLRRRWPRHLPLTGRRQATASRAGAGSQQGSAMSWLTGVMAALLRCSAGLLPADRRVWADALLAEAGEVPPGRHRLARVARGGPLTRRVAAPAPRSTLPPAIPPPGPRPARGRTAR